VQLTELTAEIFGVELAAQTEYHFSGTQLAVFTWYGCTLETSGTAERVYISDETPMVPYVNTHTQLEARRDQALTDLMAGGTATGPRVLIAGSVDSGKSRYGSI
jgi:polyribonucleotide 5'-hydroxyl-kinase